MEKVKNKVLVDEEDMAIIFDDTDEILEDLACSDEDIIAMLPKIRERLKRVQGIMNDIVDIDMYEKYYPRDLEQAFKLFSDNGLKESNKERK